MDLDPFVPVGIDRGDGALPRRLPAALPARREPARHARTRSPRSARNQQRAAARGREPGLRLERGAEDVAARRLGRRGHRGVRADRRAPRCAATAARLTPRHSRGHPRAARAGHVALGARARRHGARFRRLLRRLRLRPIGADQAAPAQAAVPAARAGAPRSPGTPVRRGAAADRGGGHGTVRDLPAALPRSGAAGAGTEPLTAPSVPSSMHRPDAPSPPDDRLREPASPVRALLVTDVVDSTRLTEMLGNADAARLWAAHDRIARDLLPEHRGREIDKSDGLLLLFADAARRGRATHWPTTARCGACTSRCRRASGVHVGPVILRENTRRRRRARAPSRSRSKASPRRPRRASCRSRIGGQTLLTRRRRRDAAARPAARLHSHGHWRLKGIAEPVELFEVGDGRRAVRAAGRPPKAYRVVARRRPVAAGARDPRTACRPSAMPSSAVRRSLEELARRFDGGARLVTLPGIGGTGKTRLAHALRAGRWLGEFPGGAWFCDLSQARSLDGIVAAVGQALDVPLGKEDRSSQLGSAIAGARPLPRHPRQLRAGGRHAEATLGRWLERAPRGAASSSPAARCSASPASQSLAAARRCRPMTAVDAVHAPRAARRSAISSRAAEDDERSRPLIQLLDGLPLAIELAAARVRVMPPRVLLSRMSERFKLLAHAAGGIDRQATLRATFDWSWDLLSRAEKAALAQLSVFEGGFTLEAAEAVLELSMVDARRWPVDAAPVAGRQVVRPAGRATSASTCWSACRNTRASVCTRPTLTRAAAPAAVARGRDAPWRVLRRARRAAGHGAAAASSSTTSCAPAGAPSRAAMRGVATRTLEAAWAGLQLRGPFAAGLELATAVGSMPDLPTCMQRAGRARRRPGV